MIQSFVVFACFFACAPQVEYGEQVASCPKDIAGILAELYAPDDVGAIGRNKPGYFHVRFQRGLHHIADYGLCARRVDVLERFLLAAEYSMQHQLESGGFQLELPDELKGKATATAADEASGVAFFVSSLGLGIYALESNDWFMQSDECERLRERLSDIKTKLLSTLEYLKAHQQHLEKVDEHAPNRLLFNAIAFFTLGKILEDSSAHKIGAKFVSAATEQIHEDGFFIEGGGFDSSYNGVATALAFRLEMIGHNQPDFDSICENAIRWQSGRISATGEISTTGNTRVNPKKGETFLGRRKDVDVGHTIEALMLASHHLSEKSYRLQAEQVFRYYRTRAGRRQ